MSDDVYNTPWSIGAKFWYPSNKGSSTLYTDRNGVERHFSAALPDVGCFTSTHVITLADAPNAVPLKYYGQLGVISNPSTMSTGFMDISPCRTLCRPWFVSMDAHWRGSFRLYASREEALAAALEKETKRLIAEKEEFLHRHEWVMQQVKSITVESNTKG